MTTTQPQPPQPTLEQAVRLLERWRTEVASWSISYRLKDDTFQFIQACDQLQPQPQQMSGGCSQ